MTFRNNFFRITAMFVAMAVPLSAAYADNKTKHVFELFTSQGCYSCPPAEELLGRIVDDHDEILALEFHVDYWDTLVYGSAGQWKDPFSSPAYSKRQRDYNKLVLEGRGGVYTPQMVVDGTYAFVGSRSMRAQSQMNKDSRLILDTSAMISENGDLNIKVDGKYGTTADVWLVLFDKEHVTDIPSGENMGKTLKNTNIVRKFESVGKWNGEPLMLDFRIEPLSSNQNCAVIVQEYDESRQRIAGPILGAARCTPA